MTKTFLFAALIWVACGPGPETGYAKPATGYVASTSIVIGEQSQPVDTLPPAEVFDVIQRAINSLNKFDIESVANLYTHNALVADDEPPYSWNGPTAGVQWVLAVEQVCKDNRLTKLKATIEPIHVYQLTTENVYTVVPVSFTGVLPERARFTAKGAFTFVLRMENGKWLIKSQVWMPKTGM
jgi:ketosteroid isomerase-like protein